MSVPVGTAKYTQFYTLQRLCTFTKGLNQPKLSSHSIRWQGKGRRLRRDLLEVLLHPSAGLTHSHLLTSTTTCQAGASPYNLVDQDRAHMTLGCTNSIFTWRNVGPFVPGWPSTSDYPSGDPGTTLNSYNLNQLPNPPRWFINLVEYLSF